ncbi:MAG: hypothetical protein Q9208_000834 [Pyrenodesmia sp. 3 TL-2023]
MGIGLHDALRALGQKAQVSLAEQGHLKMLLESQHLSHVENQVRIMNEIHAFRSLLDTSSHVRTDTTVWVPTEAAVARVVRAELRRVVKPTIEQCLNTFKANPDDQSQRRLKDMDKVAEYFGQELHETSHSCSSSASHPTSDAPIDKICTQGDTRVTGLLAAAPMGYDSSMVPERPNGFLVQHSKHWRRSKVIKWAIGTLRVTVTSTRTIFNVSYVGEIPQPQTAYRIAIEFQPAPNLIISRGLTLSLARTQDQRGHYQVCPLLATFAIVPEDADVMLFARRNDVAGLQSLFERRLAAPNDRNETGQTPLMVAAAYGSPDACRLFLAMGADPLATDDSGQGLFDWTISGFFASLVRNCDLSIAYESYTSVLRPLQSLADDLVEDSSSLPFIMTSVFLGRDSEADATRRYIETFLAYIQFLKKCGFGVNRTPDEELPPVHDVCISLLGGPQRPIKYMELALVVTLVLGGDIDAFNKFGQRPLSYTFLLIGVHSVDSQSAIELAALLLQYGADPCALDLNGLSPLDIANSVGLAAEFLEAVERSGFDVDKVMEEITRRKLIFYHGHGESTAVDNENIAAPSAQGLSKRRVVIRERDED